MDREHLQIILDRKIDNKEPHHKMDEVNDLMKKFKEYHIKNNDPNQGILICVEEMAELAQVISKIKRGIITINNISFYEELADVIICLYEITYFEFHIQNTVSDIDTIIKMIVGCDKTKPCNNLLMSIMEQMADLSKWLIHYYINIENNLLPPLDKIFNINASIICLIDEYSLDKEKIDYIKDIKFERTKNKIKNNIL